MSIPTITITGNVLPPNNVAAGGTVTFELNTVAVDLGSGVVVPRKVSTPILSGGAISQAIWPNAAGENPSRYAVYLEMIPSLDGDCPVRIKLSEIAIAVSPSTQDIGALIAAAAAATGGGALLEFQFANRAALVAKVASGLVPIPGFTYLAGGLGYLGKAGATGISDLPGLAPAGIPEPGHYTGAAFDGVTDISDALEDWLNAAPDGELHLPEGTYRATRRLDGVPCKITGRGNIVWDNGVDGIRIVATSAQPTEIHGIGLFTKGVGTGTALTIDYSGLISGGVIVPRASSHARLRDVRIGGAATLTDSVGPFTVDGWLGGVNGISLLGLDIAGGRINGVYTGGFGSVPNSDYGIQFGGSGSPVQMKIDRVVISAVKDAVSTVDAEGIYITSCEFVTVMRGVKTRGAANESGLHFVGNHVAAFDACLDLDRFNEAVVSGNNFYNGGGDLSSWPAALDGVRIGTNTNRIRVEGNLFVRVGTATAYTSVRINGGAGHEVGPNTHDIGGSNRAVIVEAAASNCFVARQNTTSSSVKPYVNSSTSTTWQEFREYTGALNDIPLSSRAAMQVYTLATGATGGPSGVDLLGAVLVTVTFDANAATRHLFPNSSEIIYTQRRVGGVWGSWERTTEVIGSNANGNYQISPKGVLTCDHTMVITSVVGTTVSATWTFPFPAIDANSRAFSNVPSASLGNIFSSVSVITATTGQVNLRRNDLAAATAVHVWMVGRAW